MSTFVRAQDTWPWGSAEAPVDTGTKARPRFGGARGEWPVWHPVLREGALQQLPAPLLPAGSPCVHGEQGQLRGSTEPSLPPCREPTHCWVGSLQQHTGSRQENEC